MKKFTRHDLVFGAVLLAAAVTRIVFFVELQGTDLVAAHLLDAQTYHEWATRLVAGNPGWYESYWMGPLYPHLLALVYLVFGVGGNAMQAIQLLLTLVNVWLVRRVALALLHADDQSRAASATALTAATLYAFYGAPVFYAGFLLMAVVVTTLYLLITWQAVRALVVPTARRWLALGLLVGLTGLARGNVLLLVTVLPLLLVGRADLARARRLRLAALLTVGAVSMIAPVTVRNVMIAQDFTILTSNGGVNLLIGQQPQADGTFSAVIGRPEAEYDPSMELSLEGDLGRDLKGSEISRILTSRAWHTFRNNLGDMPRHYLKKIWRFWSGYELPQIVAYDWWRHRFTGLRLLPVPYLLFTTLGLVGLWFLPSRTRLVLVVMVGAYSLSLLPFFPTSRYRQPIAPLLAIPAAAWLTAMVGSRYGWAHTPGRRERAVNLAFALVLACVLLPRWTALSPDRVAWQVHLHEASRASKLGNLRATLHDSRLAEEIRPGLAETSYLTAQYLEVLSAWPEALAAIERAAVRAPSSRLVLYRVGRLREGAGQLEAALAAYRRTAETSPDWAYPWLRSGLVLQRLGRLDEALAAMEKAYLRLPGNRRIRANLGSLLAENGRLEEARAVLTALTRDHPVYVNGWFNLALVEAHAGNRVAAVAAADKAAALRSLSTGERRQVEQLQAALGQTP